MLIRVVFGVVALFASEAAWAQRWAHPTGGASGPSIDAPRLIRRAGVDARGTLEELVVRGGSPGGVGVLWIDVSVGDAPHRSAADAFESAPELSVPFALDDHGSAVLALPTPRSLVGSLGGSITAWVGLSDARETGGVSFSNTVAWCAGSASDDALFPGELFRTTNNASSITSGDFDGDGFTDFVNFNSTSELELASGTGSSELETTSFVVTPGVRGPITEAVADLDGDGFDDLVVAFESAAGLQVYRGGADRPLTPGAFLPTSVGFLGEIAIADVTQDGVLDLLVGSARRARVVLFPGVGDGSFGASQEIDIADPSLGIPFDASLLAAADLDGDGLTDFVSSGGGGGPFDFAALTVALNQGGGRFASSSRKIEGRVRDLVVADVTGDSIVDLALVVRGDADAGRVVVAEGVGNGRFREIASITPVDGARDLQFADVIGDEALDLVVTNSASIVSVFEGAGQGRFGREAVVRAPRPGASDVVVVDLDGDGALDLVTSGFVVYEGLPDGGFAFASIDVFGEATLVQVEPADVDGDGALDVVTLDGLANTVTLHLGDATGDFEGVQTLPVGAGPRVARAGDLDADGSVDLVVTNEDGNSVSVFRGENGFFVPSGTVAVGVAPFDVELADLDGDGAADLVTANNGADTLSIRLGVGDGTFGAETVVAVGASPREVASGDLDGDGVADVVVTTEGPAVQVLLGVGDGTFLAPLDHELAGGVDGAFPLSLTVADLDLDGILDVVTANEDTEVNVFMGLGDGSLAPAVGVPSLGALPPQSPSTFTETTTRSADVGDVDGDGIPDLLVFHGFDVGPFVSLHRGVGDGSFAPDFRSHVVAPGFLTSSRFADVDGDGALDVLTSFFDFAVDQRSGVTTSWNLTPAAP